MFLLTFLIDDCSDILQPCRYRVTLGDKYDETKVHRILCAQSHRDVRSVYAFLCGKSIDAVSFSFESKQVTFLKKIDIVCCVFHECSDQWPCALSLLCAKHRGHVSPTRYTTHPIHHPPKIPPTQCITHPIRHPPNISC